MYLFAFILVIILWIIKHPVEVLLFIGFFIIFIILLIRILALIKVKLERYSYFRNNENSMRHHSASKSEFPNASISKKKLSRFASINEIIKKFKDKPTDFEGYIAHLYKELGYKTAVTSPSNDGGKDIVMFKENLKYVVEVKLYIQKNKIGRGQIQKLHSAMIDCKADKAIFVTTSDFTMPSVEYAQKHDIQLINGIRLMELIEKENLNK